MKVNYEKIENILDTYLSQDWIESWRLLTPGQYRINEKLDIYPKSKRYFWVPTEERGQYEDLENFLDTIL